jgi:hypothetical protein
MQERRSKRPLPPAWSNGAIRTVTVEKADGEELTLMTDKLDIVEEDLLNHFAYLCLQISVLLPRG